MGARRYAQSIPRLEALRLLGAVGCGLLGACTPLRIVLDAHPHDFASNPDRTDRVLRAFAATVVPRVAMNDPNLTRAYSDPFYRFVRYRTYFASDLCRRAGNRCGDQSFDRLNAAERVAVIQDGLAGDFVSRKLYAGAVFLAQIAVYAAIGDEGGVSPLIGFEGPYRFRGLAAITYPDPRRFLARPATVNGNFC